VRRNIRVDPGMFLIEEEGESSVGFHNGMWISLVLWIIILATINYMSG
jgi:hypothetical protein